MDSENNTKEWKLIEKTVSQLGVEQRKARRWGVFFKLLTFAYLFVLLFMMSEGLSPDKISDTEQYTALVNLEGVIASGEEANADFLVTGLRAAFEAEGTQAVVLRINSPGGSPVQSGYVYDEIKRLRGLYPETPLYAVISDIGASGAYYIAAAADKIYADKASLVGSIGVVASGFGFVDTMKKLGVERRLYTAGAHKGFLDPFSDEKGDEVEFWESVLNTTHQQFIAKVKEGRGERLKVDEEIFSGLIWSGEQALEKGLVDGLGSAGYVAREVVGAEEIIDFTPQPDPFERFTKTLGIAAGSAVGKLLTTSPLTIQ
ncbi:MULTISPECIES: S49 family peptidase [unclassified Oleiphilus]|nr:MULTISPECIES: S49 family peptidase [unclassified Oleiphilus]